METSLVLQARGPCHKFNTMGVARGHSHKTFWHKSTYPLCKIDLFKVMQQILLMLIKWSSLQKVGVNLNQSSFMR